MPKFKVLPIKAEIARSIRETMIDGEGHQLFVSIADENGYGPCRSCLKQFALGARRIVFSYSPNAVDHPYNETGPVYIHAEACEPYRETEVFPPEVENGKIKFPLVFRAYNKMGVMIDAVLQNGEPAGTIIESIFENGDVAFAHVRNAQAGCFVAHVDRAEENESA
ncbi:MAG: DUF1203 domain-containing protein [Rubrivivax sp.]|nr:DUF1203 domain-containing protein [Pyrinomonadaceae bacterium]